MKKCPKCFTECGDEMNFCIGCGSELPKNNIPVVPGNEKICSKCGRKSPKNAIFCGNCGASLTVQSVPAPSGKVCPKCGNQCRPDAIFCGKCGTSLTVQPESAPTPAPSGKVCPKCGNQCRPDAIFCGECGQSLSSASEEGIKEDRELLEEKQKLAALLETAKSFDSEFYELLNSVSADKIKSAQMIIHEYENMNFKNLYEQWKNALEPESNLSKTKQAISSCNGYCEKVLPWIKFLLS